MPQARKKFQAVEFVPGVFSVKVKRRLCYPSIVKNKLSRITINNIIKLLIVRHLILMSSPAPTRPFFLIAVRIIQDPEIASGKKQSRMLFCLKKVGAPKITLAEHSPISANAKVNSTFAATPLFRCWYRIQKLIFVKLKFKQISGRIKNIFSGWSGIFNRILPYWFFQFCFKDFIIHTAALSVFQRRHIVDSVESFLCKNRCFYAPG